MECPKGIWYEKERNRYRVKLFFDSNLYHRSYHPTFEAAYDTWLRVKREMRKPKPKVPVHQASVFNRWVCSPLAGATSSPIIGRR